MGGACVAKLFTKALLQGLRPAFPPLMCGQLCARTGGQVLDGALAAQQLSYVAAEYGMPLMFLKLDIAAAFDSVEHPARDGEGSISSNPPWGNFQKADLVIRNVECGVHIVSYTLNTKP